MTPEDRDELRAEAAMRNMAAMMTRYTPKYSDPGRDSPEEIKRIERLERRTLMWMTLAAANAADILIAELELREEVKPPIPELPPEVVRLHGGNIPAGAHILHCGHGKASYEECPECDAEHAASMAAAEKNGKNDENAKS